MVFLSLPLYKGQTITTLAEKGRKGFRAICAMVLEVGNGSNGRKGSQVGNGRKMGSRFLRRGLRGSQVVNGRKWSKKGGQIEKKG